MKKVLVAGGTGYLGGFVVREFKKRGYPVRVLIRKEDQKEKFADVDVDEFFLGDITKPDTLKNITAGIDLVFSSVGITRQKDGMTYMDVDYQGNVNILNEALKTGVKHFTYVSVFNAYKFPNLKIIQAKEKFVKELKNSGIRSCIIRPTGFFNDMKEFLMMAKSGKVFLLGDGNYKLNPVSGRDLAEFCVNSIENNLHEVEVGGPVIYTQNELAEIAFKAWNIKGKIIHIPVFFRNVILFLLRTFTSSKFYGPIEFFLSVATIDNVAPQYGKENLEEFFKKEIKKYKNSVL